MHFSLMTLGYSFLGGVLPAMIWLYFLLKEDARCPEPRHMIVLAVIAGALGVPLVLPLEHMALTFFTQASMLCTDMLSSIGFSLNCFMNTPASDTSTITPTVILAWSTIEETAKYVLAALLVLWRRYVNESVDFVIYMITVALGFAAIENVLFLIQPIADGHLAAGIATENLRFVGSTLVHVISSAAVGFALAFSFKLKKPARMLFASVGLVLAIALHAVFNFLILMGDGSHTLSAFFIVWTGAVVFLALFEILKYFRYRRLPKNTC